MKTAIARFRCAVLLAVALALPLSAIAEGPGAGVLASRSAYDVAEAVERLKKDIAAKGILLFQEIDQAALASRAGIALQPSRLLIFGNPPLGTQFLAANPQAGLDWPVRMLVYSDARGEVWVAWSDFAWIARRHGITTRDAAFHMASQVAASIAASVARP